MILLLLLSFALSVRAEAGEIIGGHEATAHSRPYMAFLRFFDKITNETMRCGGFLIQNNVVLTAAHCNGRNINVTLGTHNINSIWNWKRRKAVCAAFPHDGYEKKTKYNDIMLLKLCEKVKLTKKIKTLSLPYPQACLKPGQQCSVAGWGSTGIENELPNKLMEVELEIQKNMTCKGIYKKYDPTMQLCAGNYEEKDAMKGDSGGPLVCDNVAQGIVSYGDPKGRTPGVYTRISSFLPWIDETLRKM